MQAPFQLKTAIEASVRPTDAPFAEAVESYLRSRHDLRPWTRRTYAKSLARLGTCCPTIADLTLATMNAYLAERIAAGHPTEAHHDGGTARRFARWLVDAHILAADPLAALRIPRQPKRRRTPFTDAQVDAIMAAAATTSQSQRDITIITLAIACALRKDELRQLRWPDDVDLARAVLWIRDTKTEAGTRCVPISRKALALVDSYVKDWRPSQSPGPLFLNQHGDPFSYDGFSQIFTRLKRRLPASVNFMAHRARNTGLTDWRRAGVDIATISKLAGHTDISHTDHYLGDITPAEVARVPDAFSLFHGRRAG